MRREASSPAQPWCSRANRAAPSWPPSSPTKLAIYVFPNVTPDIYTVEVTMDASRPFARTDIRVSGGDRVGVPAMTLEVGGTTETVNVTAEALLVQSQSGERSFAVTTKQIESLPINRRNFTNLIAFTPGVKNRRRSTGGDAPGRREPEQHHDGRHLGHGHRQQRPDART